MIVLDTDHITVLRYPEHSQYDVLSKRMEDATDEVFVTSVITLEEQMRGWLKAIARAKKPHDQPLYYTRLSAMVEFFSRWTLLPFDEPAADQFEALRRNRVRISTMDLKITSIALVNNATLLTANSRDFEKVPGLHFEDWLH